ncbi:hypothetical protein AX17_002424 [Amanita inopinata Kibby_2008]|nr:hypothetical protein AX17_002424 [Amanita inopinata Kibby_2008]
MPVIRIGGNLPPVFRIFILISVVFLASIVAGLLIYGIVEIYHGYRKRQWFKAIEKAAEDLETRRIDYKAKKPVLVLPPATFSVNPIACPAPAHFPVRRKSAGWASTPAPLVRHTPPVSPINNSSVCPSHPSGEDMGEREFSVVLAVSNHVADSSVAVPSCQPRLATVAERRTVTSDADVDSDIKATVDEEHDTLGSLPDIVADKQGKQERRKMVDRKKRKHWILNDLTGARAAIPRVKLQLPTETEERTTANGDKLLADVEEEGDALSATLPVFKKTKPVKNDTGINERTNELDLGRAVSVAVSSGKSRLATVADGRTATGGAWSTTVFAISSLEKLGKNGRRTKGKRARKAGKENACVAPHTFDIPELYVNGKAYAEVEAEEAMYEIIDFYRGF